jgi:hypothetical protein
MSKSPTPIAIAINAIATPTRKSGVEGLPQKKCIKRNPITPDGHLASVAKPPMQYRGQSVRNQHLTQDTVLLARADNLGVHSHQVVVDGVLLLFLGFLDCANCLLVGEFRERAKLGWTYRCVHALAQLSLQSGASLCAVAGRCPAVYCKDVLLVTAYNL